MSRRKEVIEMIKWCGYEYSPLKGVKDVIVIYYPNVKPKKTEGISGNEIRFLRFDESFVYLDHWTWGVEPSKIYMKELLKFYLDNPSYF